MYCPQCHVQNKIREKKHIILDYKINIESTRHVNIDEENVEKEMGYIGKTEIFEM